MNALSPLRIMVFTVAGFLLVVLASSASSVNRTVKRNMLGADKDAPGILSNVMEDLSSGRSSILSPDTSSGRSSIMSPDTSLGRSSSLSSDTSSGRLIRLDTDIQEAVDAWSRYRNIVKDGFFVNDSMIVLADDDYYSDEEGGEISDNDISQDKGEAYDDQEEIIGITKESENISDPPFNNTFYSDIVVNEPQDSELGMKTNGLEQVILPQQSLPPS